MEIDELVQDIDWDMALGYEMNKMQIERAKKEIGQVKEMDKDKKYEQKMIDYEKFIERIEIYKG